MGMVKAIVRGPAPFFDGVLNPPGAIVTVDEALVSDKDYVEVEVEVRLKDPILSDGKLVRTATDTIRKRVEFRPYDGEGAALVAEAGQSTAEMATGGGDVFDVDALLAKNAEDVIATVSAGQADAFLGAIEQGEVAGKKRTTVIAALQERRGTLGA